MKVTIDWKDNMSFRLTPQAREYLESLAVRPPISRSGRVQISLAHLIRTFGPGLASGLVWSPFIRGKIQLDVTLPKKRQVSSKCGKRRRR